ncbi:MAG: hypothetical protein RR784_08450 [Burkholderiaceae bacterium]
MATKIGQQGIHIGTQRLFQLGQADIPACSRQRTLEPQREIDRQPVLRAHSLHLRRRMTGRLAQNAFDQDAIHRSASITLTDGKAETNASLRWTSNGVHREPPSRQAKRQRSARGQNRGELGRLA